MSAVLAQIIPSAGVFLDENRPGIVCENDVVDLHAVHELCRLRTTLEAFAVVRIRTKTDRQQIFAGLSKRLKALKAAAMLGNREDFHKADMNFHQFMVESAGISALLVCWNQVAEEINGWILHVKGTHWPSLMALYREHESLLEAWCSEDAVEAEQATHHHIETGWYREEMTSDALPQEGNAVDRAASFLSTHYTKPIDIQWVAKHVSFVSPSQLTRLFHKHFGMPPYMWMKQLRMERAAEFLITGALSISKVALHVGYRNTSHFIRDFRMHFGSSPGKYRRFHTRS